MTSPIHVGALLLILIAAGAFTAQVFAKKDISFSPEEQSIHVFPSIVRSETWHNLETLGMQDLGEDSLYQDFNEDNAAYVDPDGSLPSLIPQSPRRNAEVTTMPESRRSESSGSPEPDIPVVEVDGEIATSSFSVPSETISFDEPLPVEDQSDPETQNSDISDVSEEVVPLEESASEPAVDTVEETLEDQVEEPQPEPEPAAPEVSESSESPLVSFFKRVTGTFAFAQAATTTQVSDEIEVVDAVLDESTEVSATTSDPAPLLDEAAVEATATTPDTLTPPAEPLVGDVASSSDQDSILEAASEASATSGVNVLTDEVVAYSLTFEDFGVPGLASGQFINNLQLRLSLGARYGSASTSLGSLRAHYSFGDFSGEAGSILLDEETSNAMNGGYYLLPLPSITDPALLSDLTITLTFEGTLAELEGLYVDAVWLEVGTVVFDRELLKQRYAPSQLTHLMKFRNMEFLGDRLDFTRGELPEFSMRYNSQRNVMVRAVRSVLGRKLAEVRSVKFLHGGISELGIKPEVTVTPEGLITVIVSEEDKSKMKPGVYLVKFEIDEGGVLYEDSFEFQWGVLAINTNKTQFAENDSVKVSMGALSPTGSTICDAELNLYVTDPRGFISREPVIQSGLCNGNNVIDVPDYTSEFVVDQFGTYELYLERLDGNGDVISHTGSTFEVVRDQMIALERTGPTRIYPPAPYAMELSVRTFGNAFSGQLIERVPRGFIIKNTDAEIVPYADFTELVWDMSLLGSTSKSVSYEFDAPDISPYLYELGPARLVDDAAPAAVSSMQTTASGTATSTVSEMAAAPVVDTFVVFEESRQWQIASDAVGNMVLFWDGTEASIPAGWSCISCTGGAFNQQFLLGSSTYNIATGSATHTHTANGSVETTLATATNQDVSGTVVAANTHTHTYTPTIGSANNSPAYRDLLVIQYTSAGEPTTIPAGAIGVFDVASSSLPSGWNRYAVQDGYYVRGAATAGGSTGANSHTHSITGTTGAAGGTDYRAQGGTTVAGADANHTHSISSSTPSVAIEPPYIEVLLAKLDSDATAPNNLISMWTEEVPSGWVDVSSGDTAAFNQRLIKAATVYGATGGVMAHTHGDVNDILSGGASASAQSRSGTLGAPFVHDHLVDVTGFSTASNMPQAKSVVFGKRQGTDPVYEQLSFWWYANDISNQTPSDPWPSGATDLLEGESVASTSTPIKDGEEVRLRINAKVTNATSTAGTDFKLQYAAGNSCSAVLSWSYVGDTSSSTIWRGYDNSGVTDHSTISTNLLASSTVSETYEENGYATSTPNQIGVDAIGEWDFVLENNGATAGTNYCFRMVESDGTAFTTYTSYPQIFTNRAPAAPTLTKLFDNEKTASTSPWFYFYANDPEGESIHYQIQVDDNYNFGSTVIDRNTISHSAQFENQVLTSDKAPFDNGALIEFIPNTSLSNGTTYYWRVRGSDPDGSDSWGDWSEIRSFTIDTSLTVSAWFQTTEEQFDTNTFDGLETPSADHVSMISGSTTGSMIGTPIDFDDGTLGTVWGQLLFSESDASNVIEYQIEYYTDAAMWALIPDSDLPGNSAGLTTTTSLLNLDTDTYNQIRVVTNFTGTAGTPQLNDWTIEWGYRVQQPTISKLFPNEKTSTTTPTFEFTTTDPQGDDLTYQISWSADNTFAASTTRDSATHSGFADITPPLSTDPFDSGHTIQFSIQPADALTNNNTYWWRVRAKDTTGDNVYSLWTEPQSFTVDTTVTASTWFQTTEEQFDTDILSGTDALASDAVSVATTATEAMLVYGEGTETAPRYRQWNGSSWGSEGVLGDVGAPIRWAVVKAGTTREEYVAVTVGTDGDVNAQVFAAGEWGNLQEVTATMGDVNAQGFDVAYETLSGDAMVAYCDGDADPSYYTWDGTDWTAGVTSINLGNANNCEWIELISDPTSDEIIVFSRDDTASAVGSYEAQVWNGSGWGNSETLARIDEEAFAGMAAEYEDSGNQALVMGPNFKSASFIWSAWSGAAWTPTDQTATIGNDFEWGYLARDEGSDAMALCYLDEDTDIGTIVWSGSAWGTFNEHTITGNAKTDPAFSCVFETTSGRDGYVMSVYSDTTATYYDISTNGGTSWAGGTQINTIGDTATMELQRTGDGMILGTFFDDVNDSLLATEWNGTSWSTTATLENDMPVNAAPFGRPYSTAPRNPGTEGTVIVSPGIDFTDGTGPYWQEMSWVDSTPGTSEILYSVQYWDGDSWQFIPNAALPGNESGTTTSPIDLSGLNVNTYDLIRPYAALTCDGSNNCPTLQDWTVTWAEGITVSGTLDQYDQTTAVNSGTIAVAVNGVLQTGKTGSVSGGVWSIANVTVFDGDIVTVFVSDTADSSEAVGVARYDGIGDISGMQLYERHLTLGSDDSMATPLTNADVALYNVSNDEDVFFGLSGSALDVCATTGCDDVELYINASTTYRPGSNVLTHDVENNGTLVATTTLYVDGSWDNNATTTMTGSTVVFAATSTTESVDSTGAFTSTFNNVVFGTTTGSGVWAASSSLDINGNLTVLRGTLARGSEPITIAGNLTNGVSGFWTGIGTTTFDGSGTKNWSDQNATLQNVGNVVIDGASKTIVLSGDVAAESVTIGADDVLNASATGYDITVYDNWVNNNVFAAQTGTVYFAATATGKEITTGGDAFYNLTFSGVDGAWSFTESTLTVNNDFTVATGTVTMPTATTTIAGSFSAAGGTFAHNNAVIAFTSTGAETINASTTAFTNEFYDLVFDGAGSWTFIDQNATTINDLLVIQGNAIFPTGTLSVGGRLADLGGSFSHNGGTVVLTSTFAENLTAGGSSFNNLTTTGSGSWAFTDTNATIAGDLTISSGTLTLPGGVLSLGGSLLNTATLQHNTGQITFNSTDAGETIDTGNSLLYDVLFNSVTGGWTITSDATTTNDFTLATSSDFALSGGQVLEVGGSFTNYVGGASTTWAGSTLYLNSATDYEINTKFAGGDTYGTLAVGADTDISMWNSDSTTYVIDATGSLYSQDHSAVDGDLYVFGEYTRTSGTEYWSYATDFDGSDLSGGSERQASIFFASGATAAITTATLEVLGTSTASSTVQNQGSGTYQIAVGAGTTTAQYYSFDDLGLTGLSLLTGTYVTSLRDGTLTGATGGGALLTVDNTTIDANPAKQIYNVGFSTTTPILVSNVNQIGGAPSSYWWFRNSYGNADGEALDNDTGDPGSIRWDDSSLLVTIAGTVYENDRSTPLNTSTCGTGAPVTVKVENGGTYTGSCAAGVYSIPNVVIVGDPTLTVYLDGADNGERAAAVTKTVTADVTDLDLYVDHVIVRHEDTEAMAIDDMAAFDSVDDLDVQFLAATGTPETLNVLAGNALYVWATTTFTPGGTVTLHGNGEANDYDGSLYIGGDATFTGADNTTYTIAGSFIMGSGGSFIPASSTVVMNATTTGKTINAAVGDTINFKQLWFTGVGGGWNLNGNASTTGNVYVATGTLSGTGDLTVADGSLFGNGLVAFGSGKVVIENTNTFGGIQSWTFGDLTLGNGTEVGTTSPASNATTTILGTLTIANAHFLDAGSSVWDLSGSGTAFVESGTFLEDTSTVVYSGTGATTILGTEYYNLTLDAVGGSPTYTAVGSGLQVFGDLTVGPDAATTVTFDTNDPALNIDGDMFIGTNGTFVASDGGSFTLAGSYDNNGTFTGSGGSITFDGVGTHTIAAGSSDFSSLIINGTGDFTVTEHATATDAWTLSAANTFTLNTGLVLAVGGTFTNDIGAGTTWTGSTLSLYGGGNYTINSKGGGDSYATLSIAANTQIRVWDSTASTISVDSSGSLYSMDHADTAGDLYIFGAYEKTSGTDYWSYSTDFDGAALGGSARKVDVYFESGASARYTGGDLAVVGGSTASTTLQNQGAGNYSFTIGNGASTTWSYYEVRDTDIDGLVFTGAPTVHDISHGDYLVSVNNGTAITLGGMVIDANPAETFSYNIFNDSVTTAYNVTATGTSVSSWRFTLHAGTIDGEGFDVDPDGDPGYVAWDDSAALITIAGRVFQSDGSSVSSVCDDSTPNIALFVDGNSAGTASCASADGTFSIPNVSYTAGNSLVAFISGETVQAATVSEDPVSNINNLHIYEGHVIVRHESVDPLSIDDMAVYDSSNNADIPFTAVSGSPDTLSIAADTKLLVWANKTFEPGGDVTLSNAGTETYRGDVELQAGATYTANPGEVLTVGGSFISAAGALYDASTASTTFTSTAAETIDINDGSFYNVQFTGSGSWSITDSVFDINNFNMTGGTLTLPSGTSTVSGHFSNSGGTITHNGSLMVFDGSGAGNTVTFDGSPVAELRFTGSGSWSMDDTDATSTNAVTVTSGSLTLPSGTLAIGGSFRNEGGAITHNTSHLIISTSTNATLRASSSDLYSVTFAGGGIFAMSDDSLTLLGDLTVSSGTLGLASSTLSIGGSFDAVGGTFNSATGTVLFNSSDTGETIDPGVSSFYNVNIASALGGWTITGDATTTNNFTLSSASDFTLGSGNVLTVEGVFTNSVGGSATNWSGSTLNLTSGTEYSINGKGDTGDAYQTLTIGAHTDLSAWNSFATTTTVAPSGSLYSQDHASQDGALNIYGDYHISTTTEYWSYATDFNGDDLSGGSERAVTVSIAANATTSLDGGVLYITGTAGNETTITNQGSGTYAFVVSDGTYSATYYQYRNLNSNGLTLSGTPTIPTLNYGDFELAVNGGNLISLSSTTLNANASLVITGARFATTTSITGYNVNLSGVTASAWTFVAHTGNLDGEGFDVDGGTACGQVRWDDSSCLLTQQTHYRWRNDDGGLNVPDSEWMDADWNARQRVRVVNNDATTYTDPVVELTVVYDLDMQSDFDDLRFTDSTGTTSIPYFIASSTASTLAEVWVKVPTLPASDAAEIYMYYSNGTALTTSSSTETFVAADDFEDNGITEYSGDTSLFTVDGSFAYGGSYGLDNTGHETDKATDGIARLDQTISQGEIIRYMQYVDTSAGADNEVCTLFGVQSPVTANQNYGVCIEQYGIDRIAIVENVEATDSENADADGQSPVVLASTTVTYATGWYAVEIDWQTDNSIDVSLYNSAGSLAASVSASDSTYTSGGYGFTYWDHNGGWDNFTSRTRVATEPTVLFGAEQGDGGATWAADLDSVATEFTVGEIARLRVAVENTGLAVNDTYQLEYASLGASPSCEAVDGSKYAAVKPFASCGTDPICMATSTTVANGAVTGDLLAGPEIDFTAGRFVEDPSNTAASLTLQQNEYTEVEYAVVAKSNISDVNACFRVTDSSGSDLDTYLRVARMNVRFDPSLGAITFNEGDHISLVAGTTTRVYATSTVTDLNGYGDIVSATSTMYRSGAGAACTADPNNCYIAGGAPQCTFTNCSGNRCDVECYADFYYHADPTDTGSTYDGEQWIAMIEVVDQQGGIDIDSSVGVTEVYTLHALTVDDAIDYGALEVMQSTDGASTTVANLGNSPIDVQIIGSDLSDGNTSLIPTEEQVFATSSFTYGSCGYCTNASTSPINYEVDLTKPTSSSTPVTDKIYWGIYVPFGTRSNPHSGINTFIAIDD